MNSKNLFIELELSDIKLKIRELIATKSKLKIWSNSQQVASVEIFAIEEDTLIIDDNHSLNGVVMANFSLRYMSYFFKGIVDGGKLKIDGKVYRSERRADMRFNVSYMTSSYLYFDAVEEDLPSADNVLHFNKSKNKEDSFIKDFSSSMSDFPELRGAKLIDISSNGASFVMSLQDFKNFSNKKFSMGTLVLEKNSYDISNIQKVYDIDYVNFRLDNIPMKKIGIKFESNGELESYLQELDDKSIILTSLDEEFNKYINQKIEE
ncbi:hypothetical protein [Halobacteriovorax sp. ZH5_bin.2]|uniref:hypothetical protein n=1 Tax=unclassified Halobacteriovorax TaxID=2639665 RepID=UPI0037182DE3